MKKIIVLFICAVLIAGTVMPVYAENVNDQQLAEDEWVCPECGETAAGNFCSNCGAARPQNNEEWTCPECGELVTGNFCNNCGAPKPTDENAELEPTEEIETEAEIEEETEADKETETDKPEKSDNSAAVNTDEPNIAETVLVDEKGIKITAKEIDYSGRSPELKLLLENNTDGEVDFYSGTTHSNVNSINSYMSGGYLNETVSAGKKANVKIRLHDEDLEVIGISRIAELQIGFYVEDADRNEILRTDPIRIPTEIVDSYDLSSESLVEHLETSDYLSSLGAELLFSHKENFLETDLAELSSICAIKNKDDDTVLLVDVVNTSDDLLYAGINDIYVNDFLVCSGLWSSDTVTPGKHRVLSATINNMLDDNFWDVVGISSIDKITFTLTIKDKDYKDVYYYEDISLHPTANEPSFDTSGDELYNEGGIRLINKGLIEDEFDYSEDFHLLLMVENTTGRDLYITEESNTSAINGYMSYAYYMSTTIKDGTWGLLDVQYADSDFENAGIESLADVENVEIGINVKDDDTYDDIVSIPVSVEHNKIITME